MRFRAIFFDLFNTVAHFYPTREERQVRAAKKFGFDIEEAVVRKAYVDADSFLNLENARLPFSRRSREEMQAFWGDNEKLLLAAVGISVSQERALEIHQVYKQQKSDLVLYDDVLPAISVLSERGFTLGLISNMDDDLKSICEQLGLARHINVCVSSKDVGAVKPDPEIFRAALEMAKAKPEEAIHVGDQYHSDVVGARQSGILPILLDRDGFASVPEDCIKIKALGEVRFYALSD